MMPALIAFAVMLALAFARVPIALAMGLTGFAGLAILKGINPAMGSVAATVWESGFQITLSVIPLFILMGNFVTKAGMARELFRATHSFVGHLRGGLAMATIMACAGFGAICGSSIATAATMTKVAYPSMKEIGYSDELATGSIAAGGTLGILIPPSTIMVIYGIMTETNIGKLFAAGFCPDWWRRYYCVWRCNTFAGVTPKPARATRVRHGLSGCALCAARAVRSVATCLSDGVVSFGPEAGWPSSAKLARLPILKPVLKDIRCLRIE